MCKKIIYSILTLVCLTACKKEVSQSKADDSIQQTDTVYENHVATVYGPLTQKKDTLVTINGSTYKIECHAVMDTLKKLSETVIRHDSVSNKVYKSDYTGYDVTYTINLSKDNKSVFTKSFTKKDFDGQIGKDALLQAMVDLPCFQGYHPGFKALMFTLDFWIPETDIGDQCFIMIGMDGKVIEKSFNNNFGGGGPDGTIEVPANNAFVLTCAKILNTDGKVVDLIDGLKTVAHTKLINDHTILVVYDPEEGDTKDNASLIDNYGKVLKTFTYKGYYDLLGYVVPSYFEKTTGSYIMLDDQLNNITVIPADNPLGIFTVSSKALSEAKTNPEHEVTFDINTETSEQTFVIDTVTKAIRLVKQRK